MYLENLKLEGNPVAFNLFWKLKFNIIKKNYLYFEKDIQLLNL